MIGPHTFRFVLETHTEFAVQHIWHFQLRAEPIDFELAVLVSVPAIEVSQSADEKENNSRRKGKHPKRA